MSGYQWNSPSYFGSGGKKPEEPIAMTPSLDSNQQALADQLKKMLSGVKSPEDYLSELTTYLSSAQTGGLGGPLGGATEDALRRAMSGEVSEDYWQNTIVGPATKTFERDIAPRLREESVGPGTYWGGARAENVGKGYSDLADSIAAARGKMGNVALNRAAATALGYSGQLSQNVGNWINAFMKANPSYSDTINAIMQYLNTPTQLAYQNPEYIPEAIKKAMQGGNWSSYNIPAGGA